MRQALGIEAGHEPVLNLVGVGKDVTFGELHDISEVVYPRHKPVHGAWFDDLLPFSSHEFFIKDALERRRTQFHGGLHGVAINWMVAGLPGVLFKLSHEAFRAISVMEG